MIKNDTENNVEMLMKIQCEYDEMIKWSENG